MEILKSTKKLRCDVPTCKNMSEYVIELKKHFLAGNLFLCKDCLTEMHRVLGKEIAPPVVKNIYKKNSEVKE